MNTLRDNCFFLIFIQRNPKKIDNTAYVYEQSDNDKGNTKYYERMTLNLFRVLFHWKRNMV